MATKSRMDKYVRASSSTTEHNTAMQVNKFKLPPAVQMSLTIVMLNARGRRPDNVCSVFPSM